MSEQYSNEMRWVLFKHDKKGNDKAPDYKGKAQIGGVEYVLSGWIRTPANGGDKFMSGSVELKKDKAPAPAPVQPPGDNDDVPF